jgi:Uma2 family endonuclease
MSTLAAKKELVLGRGWNGVLMTPEEFDAVKRYNENYCYELVNGVVIVNPIPLGEETGPNELLGHWLLLYKESHPQGSALHHTLPQQYVYTRTSRRLADRLIWTGLGRVPDRERDLPSIAVEFVSAGGRNRRRDYVDKRADYAEAGIAHYWIIDRFQRTLTVIDNRPNGQPDQVVSENQTYRSPFLPGFDLPLRQLLESADQWAQARRRK